MTDELNREARATLQRYLDGRVSNGELAGWLVQVEYDEEIPQLQRDQLAGLRLVVTEVSEGHRPTEHILEAVAALLATLAPGEQVIAERTSSATCWTRNESVITASGNRVQYAGI